MPVSGLRNYLRRASSFGASVLEANFRDLPLPYRLFLYITDACNCRCNMCNIWQKPTDNELTTGELLEVLANARHHLKWMDITGGEIFLRADILELFRFVAAELPHLFMFHFATNGLLTDRIVDAARVISRSSIPHFIVTVSLDGPEELHTRIRGVPGIWPRAMETFRRLRSERIPVVFGMTLTEHNYDCYDQTLTAVRREIPEIGTQDFHVNLAQISDLYYDNRHLIQPPLDRMLTHIESIHTSRTRSLHPVNLLERAYLHHARTYVRTRVSPLLCEALSSSAVLGTRGELFPCIIYNRSVGNVRQHAYSIGRLWESHRRAQLRTEIRGGHCPHCWTPCEAYQSLLANALPGGKNRRHPPAFLETGQVPLPAAMSEAV